MWYLACGTKETWAELDEEEDSVDKVRATEKAPSLPEATVRAGNWDAISCATSPPTCSGSVISEAEMLPGRR